GSRRVEDGAGVLGLLADRWQAAVLAGVGRVPDLEHQLVGTAGELRGDVEAERVVAAGVRADLYAVDPDRGLPVHRAEVELDAPARPGGRHGEGTAVEQVVAVVVGGAHDA